MARPHPLSRENEHSSSKGHLAGASSSHPTGDCHEVPRAQEMWMRWLVSVRQACRMPVHQYILSYVLGQLLLVLMDWMIVTIFCASDGIISTTLLYTWRRHRDTAVFFLSPIGLFISLSAVASGGHMLRTHPDPFPPSVDTRVQHRGERPTCHERLPPAHITPLLSVARSRRCPHRAKILGVQAQMLHLQLANKHEGDTLQKYRQVNDSLVKDNVSLRSRRALLETKFQEALSLAEVAARERDDDLESMKQMKKKLSMAGQHDYEKDYSRVNRRYTETLLHVERQNAELSRLNQVVDAARHLISSRTEALRRQGLVHRASLRWRLATAKSFQAEAERFHLRSFYRRSANILFLGRVRDSRPSLRGTGMGVLDVLFDAETHPAQYPSFVAANVDLNLSTLRRPVCFVADGESGSGKSYGTFEGEAATAPSILSRLEECMYTNGGRNHDNGTPEPAIMISLTEFQESTAIDHLQSLERPDIGTHRLSPVHAGRRGRDGCTWYYLHPPCHIASNKATASLAPAIEILRRAVGRRRTTATTLNATSSRGHLVLSIRVRGKGTTVGDVVFLVIDLAGSEVGMDKTDLDRLDPGGRYIHASRLAILSQLRAFASGDVVSRNTKSIRCWEDCLKSEPPPRIVHTTHMHAGQSDESLRASLSLVEDLRDKQNRKLAKTRTTSDGQKSMTPR